MSETESAPTTETGGDLWELAYLGSDSEWFKVTGMCGYCGQDCGCGVCKGDDCTTCPDLKGATR